MRFRIENAWKRSVAIAGAISAAAIFMAVTVGAQANITEFGVPTSGSQPTNLAIDSSGNVVFTELSANNIGRMDPNGNFQEFGVGTASSQPWGIAVDSTGRAWFTEAAGNKIGNMTSGGQMGQDNIPTSGSQPRGIAVDAAGNVWFAESAGNKIGRLSGSAFSEFSIPTSNAQPWGLVIDPSGNIWFTERNGNRIGRMSQAGVFSEFGIPTSGSQPTGIALDASGNVWFAEYAGNKIGEMTPTGVFTEINIPTGSSNPMSVAVDKAGGVWFTESAANIIGRVLNGQVTEYGSPTPGSTPFGIAVDASGNVYFTEQAGNKIARATGLAAPAATATATATPVPSTATPGPTATPQPAPVVPHDNRYFAQTGYRIDNDTFWDYFNKRGGIRTFGYPVSRTFTFLGFTTQFFQREIMQLAPDGSPRTMNILDPGLMPYTKINGSTFPAPDPSMAASAPVPGSPNYAANVQAFVQNNAPNQFNGMNVNFYQTFVNTVTMQDAYPNGGGDPNLLPLLNLEIWGVPTSKPMADPTNSNFVYLRFQRGIMHYDATNGYTQGLLLADYLKAIITGMNLPPDLDAQANGSIFYHQYNPAKPGWVDRPNDLPGTDMTNAFTQE
ncbi:MAG: NHL repeat-containing protein [Bacteroidetes bacterium]|nr:NHL repeat-containing protein [Bacteroidota bacterium]